jgi:hypothetical protein
LKIFVEGGKEEVEIWVEGEKKGIGKWVVRMIEGVRLHLGVGNGR